jgi:DNA-binding NarL/FixJ family response regulator
MIRVAIVEDSKTIRESLTHFVQTDPECRCVFACATAEEALVGIPKHQPEVVLMDIQLPKLSGIECTAQIKKLLPAVQIIMVTVYEDTERIFKALRAGACGYLLKRCTPEELLSAIREVRQGGAPMSRDIARKVIASFQEPLTTAAEVEEIGRAHV